MRNCISKILKDIVLISNEGVKNESFFIKGYDKYAFDKYIKKDIREHIL